MKTLIKFIAIAFIFTGCAFGQVGQWTHKSGGTATKVAKDGDSVIMQIPAGTIQIEPFGVNDQYGFNIKVNINNTSEKLLSYKHTDFKIQNADGEIFDSLDEAAVQNLVNGSVAQAGIYAGGNALTQASVNSSMWSEIKAKLITAGDIPSHSKKTGVLYFPKAAAMGLVKFRIDARLAGTEKTAEFSSTAK